MRVRFLELASNRQQPSSSVHFAIALEEIARDQEAQITVLNKSGPKRGIRILNRTVHIRSLGLFIQFGLKGAKSLQLTFSSCRIRLSSSVMFA